jgi:hypothetical protein
MAAVWMHIDKFGGRVKIDADHPLAVAQRAKNAAAPSVSVSPVVVNAEKPIMQATDPAAYPVAEKPRRRGRAK